MLRLALIGATAAASASVDKPGTNTLAADVVGKHATRLQDTSATELNNVINRPSMPQYSGWALQHLSDQMEIVFAVASGKENHDTRAKAVTETWCAELRNCIYFSDAENPNNEPPTIAISEDALPPGLDIYQKAQLRFLPMLNYMKNIINQNPKGVFTSVNWIVMCDDDTYVFYHNLYWYLQELDPKQPVYTGDVIPDSWIPVNRDGS